MGGGRDREREDDALVRALFSVKVLPVIATFCMIYVSAHLAWHTDLAILAPGSLCICCIPEKAGFRNPLCFSFAWGRLDRAMGGGSRHMV